MGLLCAWCRFCNGSGVNLFLFGCTGEGSAGGSTGGSVTRFRLNLPCALARQVEFANGNILGSCRSSCDGGIGAGGSVRSGSVVALYPLDRACTRA